MDQPVPIPNEDEYSASTYLLLCNVILHFVFASPFPMAAVQKVALITAGTAGLGAQIARALAPDFRLVSEAHICNKDLDA